MGYLGGLVRNAHPRELVLFSGYALYLVFSYMMFHSATVLSTGGSLPHFDEVLFLSSIFLARVLAYAVFACFYRFMKRLALGVLAAVTGAIALMGFVVMGMLFQFSGLLPTEELLPWLLFTGLLLGVADALITLFWARFSATLSLRTVYLYVVLCNALSLVIYFIVTLFPAWTAIPVATALFIASLVFVKKALNVREPLVWEFSQPVLTGALRRMVNPIFGTSILCFMGGLMLEISGQQEVPLSSFQQTSLLTSAVVVLCLLLPALLLKKPLNIERMYAIALPLSAAGFLLLPLLWNAAGGIVNSFAQLGSMVAGIILWCMLADIAYDTKLPSWLLFPIALICTNLAQLAGILVGYFNVDQITQSDIVLTTVALVAVYFLFMVALLLFKDKSFKGEEKGQSIISPRHSEQLLESRSAEVAAENQFTPRETDTFLLLAQGFTIPDISEKLFVSENTVKSHVKSIYQKLDIHTRSELIELVSDRA